MENIDKVARKKERTTRRNKDKKERIEEQTETGVKEQRKDKRRNGERLEVKGIDQNAKWQG